MLVGQREKNVNKSSGKLSCGNSYKSKQRLAHTYIHTYAHTPTRSRAHYIHIITLHLHHLCICGNCGMQQTVDERQVKIALRAAMHGQHMWHATQCALLGLVRTGGWLYSSPL
ncbi:unnamed protein product [Ceratitis capitata]|uniref:(Mediterranean fruit fly) hypothetical protein n=1 Tax=Ceratitis capitata TaxID=7213 RepID=A0A811V6N7_CERCA|nr:unnamed protein product [Ceratitis capitata]